MNELLIALLVIGGIVIILGAWSVGYGRGWSKGYFEGRFDEWERRSDED